MNEEYKKLSKYYDVVELLMERLRNRVAKIILERKCRNVLDVCCGTGSQASKIVREGIYVVGIDLSDDMLKVANKKKQKNLLLIKGDATNMPIKDSSFDCVTIQLALHEKNSFEQKKIIKEMKRIVKKKGILVFLDYESKVKGVLPKISRILPFAIEWGIGGAHYANYRNYIKNGGLDELLRQNKVKIIEKQAFFNKNIVTIVARQP